MSTDKQLSDEAITEIYLAWSARTKTELITFHAFARELIEADRKLAQGETVAWQYRGPSTRDEWCEADASMVEWARRQPDYAVRGLCLAAPQLAQPRGEPKEVVDQILSHLSRCIECSVYENEVVPAIESFVYETLAAHQLAQPISADDADLVSRLRASVGDAESWERVQVSAANVMAAVDRIEAGIARPQGEPVAWQIIDPSEADEFSAAPRRVTWINPEEAEGAYDGFVVTPLYAAPQAAVPANNSEHQVERDSLPAAALGRSLVDAARYRYLRDSAVWDDAPLLRGAMVWCVIGSSANACRPCETDELDEAIDEALAAAARTEAQQDEPKITDQRALVGEPFLPKDSLGHSV